MPLWFLILLIIVSCFGLVVLRGAPYLPTKRAQVNAGLDLLNLKPGQTVYDLGSGDGTVLKAAAERKLKAVGYEINPILWLIATLRLLRYRSLVKVRLGDYWHHSLKDADGVFVFLIGHHMERLDAKLQAEAKPNLPVVSVAFEFPGRKPLKRKLGVHLYQIDQRSKM